MEAVTRKVSSEQIQYLIILIYCIKCFASYFFNNPCSRFENIDCEIKDVTIYFSACNSNDIIQLLI